MTPHARLASALAALAGAAAATFAQSSFSIVALPDTQNYVNNSANAPLFTAQTQWVSDQIQLQGNPRNIVFVTHLGDLVSTGTNTTQWDRAESSMNVLDSVIAYSALPGNHDFAVTGNKATGTDEYVARFGPSRFAGRDYYGGADPSGNNSYQVFTGAGQEFLHIALEWQPHVNVTNGPTRELAPLEWAQQIIREHPGMPTIISTHEHVDDSPPGRSSAGNQTWNQLVRLNDQIIMVLNGHFHSLSVGSGNDGEYHQVSLNDFGNPVLEVLSDYQDYPNGGDGWLRIVTFDFEGGDGSGEVRFETFSPVLNDFQTETVQQVGPFASQFGIPINFPERFMFAPPPEPPIPPREIFEELIIRQGLNGYSGTLDKEIRSSGGDAANGQDSTISIDGDDGSPGRQPNHALVRFEAAFGDGPAQIATDTVIEEASLRLGVINPGSGFELYEMTTAWDESTTWQDFGGDGITPGIEAATSPILTLGANNSQENVAAGTLELNISDLVRQWAAGGPNFGVGFRTFPNGTNGIDFTTSESSNPPELVIRSLLPEIRAVSFTQGAGDYGDAADTQLLEASPTSDESAATTLSIDGSDGGGANNILIRFGNLFGSGDGQVTFDADIARAILTVTADDPGDGASVHRVLENWQDTETWNSAFGNDGVQANNSEALATADAVVIGATGRVEIDVTASVLAWQANESPNFGWALLPLGSNGWDIASSEAALNRRPTLTIFVDTSPRGCNPADLTEPFGVLDIGDVVAFLGAFGSGDPAADYAAPTGAFDIGDVVAFLGLFGAGCP